ncbi:SusC/RagA family TonB-linked outer membrane protein [Flavivirga sp. 57AJ16]|uniref:SusC/RagA family TonB-linked outer membrane protein n=1 Tax=Flavivirga sp. 57AJ16 TaxID=3025307 RepID=UPI0023673636|nr:SusC/RagA family TonB-linked outer membrane protein [Flavivirga sp. 57AJ16]MDD7886295.1 SusC/RagA family TonB-linked outer membrane protein [Flavivirga sp. 57AJ16]
MKCIIKTIFFLFLFSFQTLLSQNVITGVVTDEKGFPLAGVSIIESNVSNGAITDFDGLYSISPKTENPSLTFSFIGFKPVTIDVGTKNVIDVIMVEAIEDLDAVIVNAIGFTKKKDNLGYASSTVKGGAVSESGEANVLNALSGKSSGVRISRNSGDPGAGSFIQIRGLSSITRNSQPLIILDGIPISNDVRGNSDRGGVSQESRLNDINPNDIESITVLKGAAAAALWGTQALGGVINITTKSGKYNSKLNISLKSTYSLDQINVKYPVQTKYGQGDNGVYDQRARDSWGDLISDRSGGHDDFDTSGEFYLDQNGSIYYPILNKNSQAIYNDSNFDQVFGNGHFLENNLSLSGGTAKSTMFFSLSDLDQKGIIKNNSDYRRSTVRFNAKQNFTEATSLKISSTYTRTSSNRIRLGANSSGLYLGLLRNPADFDISGYRGDYYASSDSSPIPNRQRSYREPLGADGSATYNNPLWTINEQENKAKVDRFITNFEFMTSPNSWLTFIARAGVDHYNETRSEFITPGSAAGDFTAGFIDQSTASNTIFNTDFIAKTTFNLENIVDGSFLLGFNYNSKSRTVNGVEGNGFIQFLDVDSGIRDIDNTLIENTVVSSTFGQERTAGLYSSLSFSLYDMFYIDSTIRIENASTFGDNSDTPFLFPSTSLAWQFSQLDIFKESNILSFGKIRASYAEVGVQPARYNTSNIFVSPTYSDALGGGLNSGLFGNGAFVPSTNRGNSSLRPERKKEFEIGTDLRFFNNKLSFGLTYFENVTEDVLLDFPVANSTGYSAIYTNGAEIENKGLELDLGYKILNTNDFSWSIDANFTKVKNEVTDLAGAESLNLGGLAAISSRAVEGQPLGVLWGSRTLRNDDGSIVYDEFGFPEQDQLEGVIGDPNPDWQGGITSTFKYKNFRLSVLFETYQGADIYAGTKSVMRDLGTWYDTGNEVTATRNYFESNGNIINIGETFRGNIADFGAGPVALTETWYNGEGGFFGAGNDELYIEDGSWTRLRELALSYLWKSDWLKKSTSLKSIEFTATGRNLFLWTDFEGNDPDTNLSGVSAARGLDYFNNPGTKSFLFSVTLNL